MLTITGHADNSAGSVVIDPYVPLTFKTSPEVLAMPYIWQCGNLKTSLLEIKVDRYSTRLGAVCLVMFPDTPAVNASHPVFHNRIDACYGIPTLHARIFIEPVVREYRDIDVILGDFQCAILWAQNTDPDMYFESGRARMLADKEGRLIGMLTANLTQEEYDVLSMIGQNKVVRSQ